MRQFPRGSFPNNCKTNSEFNNDVPQNLHHLDLHAERDLDFYDFNKEVTYDHWNSNSQLHKDVPLGPTDLDKNAIPYLWKAPDIKLNNDSPQLMAAYINENPAPLLENIVNQTCLADIDEDKTEDNIGSGNDPSGAQHTLQLNPSLQRSVLMNR